MSMTLLAALTLAASAIPPPPDAAHSTRVEHRGQPVDVDYRAALRVATRQVGMAPAARQSTQLCLWSVTADVSRAVARPGSGKPLTRTIASDRLFKGSRAGDCVAQRRAIGREVAGRDAEVNAHLAAVAARDRGQLAADLDAIDAFAAN